MRSAKTQSLPSAKWVQADLLRNSGLCSSDSRALRLVSCKAESSFLDCSLMSLACSRVWILWSNRSVVPRALSPRLIQRRRYPFSGFRRSIRLPFLVCCAWIADRGHAGESCGTPRWIYPQHSRATMTFAARCDSHPAACSVHRELETSFSPLPTP